MYRGRQSRRGRGGGGGSSYSRGRSAKGLFKDNIWYCDCEPQRLPAEHFKVKKEGKNKGRWFYTCQQEDSKRCGFFLWDEDAEPRMQAAVLNGNAAQESTRRASDQVGWTAGRGVGDEEPSRGKGLFAGSRHAGQDAETESEGPSSPPPAYSSAPNDTRSGQKRRANHAHLDDDDEESYEWDPTQLNEGDLIKAADSAPNTPHKAQKTGVYATPATSVGRKLPWLEGEQTETLRGNSKNVTFLDTPSKSNNSTARDEGPTTPIAPTTGSNILNSPLPPARYKDALDNPADSHATLTNEALTALSSVTIPPDTLSKLRGILTKHDLRTQGIVKGRDISRLALKAKEAKVVELQAKIATLEAEQELQKHMRAVFGRSAEDDVQSTEEQVQSTQDTASSLVTTLTSKLQNGEHRDKT